MAKLFKYGLLFFLITINCVTTYNFEPDEWDSYLVVSGGINQLDNYNQIKLFSSTKYGTSVNSNPINDAEIMLVNSINESEPFFFEGDGIYTYFGTDLKVTVGESYHIEITLENKTYKTQPQKVPEPVPPDSLNYKFGYRTSVNLIGNEVTYENVDIFINTPININGQTSYLRWKVDESWVFTEIVCSPLARPKSCYMSNKLETERIFTFSSKGISGNYLERKLIAQKRITDRVEFIERHFFNAYQYSLPKDAYDYWEKVVALANPSGDIFDLPPAPLRGNVYNIEDSEEIVLGYFEVASKSVVRVDLTQADIHPLTISSKDYLCGWWTDFRQVCCNCLLLDNSSTERPDYW
jgi:hypothetical protein